jgi:GAF domain-containing protein/HAMP domain-containing protein
LTNSLAAELRRFQRNFPDHVELFITDRYGGLVAATNRTSDYAQADKAWWQAAYNDGQGAIFVSHQPEYDESSASLALLIGLPLYDDRGVLLGVLRSTYRLTTLDTVLASVTLGQSGQTELYFPGGLEFESGKGQLEPVELDLSLLTQAAALGQDYLDTTYDGVPSLVSQAAVTDITDNPIVADLGWKIVIHQDRQEALLLVREQGRSLLLIIFVVVAGAGFGAVGLAQILVNPIMHLIEVAQRIAAGDLTIQVKSEARDEIGLLAATFNTMTGQLRETFGSLEERVADRTRQLETVVQVSQQLSGILDLSDLLRAVVTRIKETFGYYHVHVYLLQAGALIMAEGYGQAGAEMKRQGHNIALAAEKSLVARAARQRRIITVENVQEDENWLPNPLLPATRSEMAVPIQFGTEVVGVLDVQSEHIGGLTAEDEATLQALANQIATAVANARAFTETQQALIQAQEIQRRYTGQAWQHLSSGRDSTDYEVSRSNLAPLAHSPTPEALAALQQGRTINMRQPLTTPRTNDPVNGQESGPVVALATPLKLRNQIIGVLGLQDENPERQWTEDEIALIEAVSEQMSLALENARLFEKTQRDAWRDRIISESAARVWSSSEIEEVLKVAVAQLGDQLQASEVVIRLGTEDELATD